MLRAVASTRRCERSEQISLVLRTDVAWTRRLTGKTRETVMIIASHAVFAAYGFWPPNEERGSWSDVVWAKHLRPFGEPNRVTTSRSVAHRPYNRDRRRAIQAAMKFPPVRFNNEQRAAIADGIAEVVQLLNLRLFACAVLQDHVHILVTRHRADVETLIGYLKRAATRRFTRLGIHPMHDAKRPDGASITPWVRGGWKRFLDTNAGIVDASDYVWRNFARSGIQPVQYPFVQPLKSDFG